MSTQSPRFSIIILHSESSNANEIERVNVFIILSSEEQHNYLKSLFESKGYSISKRNAALDICWWVDFRTARILADNYGASILLYNELNIH